MTRHKNDTALHAVVVSVLILGTVGFGLSRVTPHDSGTVVRHYQPTGATPRIRFLGDPVRGALNVRDFDASGDEIFLLDAAAPRVIVMQENAGHWTVARSFGRHGGGPGEMLEPSGIAVSGDTVLIADRDRVHYFNRDGRFLGTRAPMLPCMLIDPHVYSGQGGLFLSGRCMRADTSTAELFFVARDSSVSSVAHDPLFTSDGKIGSMFAASNFFTPGEDHGLFGGGTSDCVFRIASSSAAVHSPRSERVCGLGAVRYPFFASPRFVAKTKALAAARPFAAGAMTVPKLLPVYSDRIAARNADIILRPISNDSFAFRETGSNRDIMVAEIDGLVACRAAGCMWMRQDTTAEMMFIPLSVLEGAVGISH